MRIAILLFLMTIAAKAQVNMADKECSSDRPNRKEVRSHFSFCTLVACVPRLRCSVNECYYEPTSCINSCTYPTLEICLSDKELEEAHR